MKLNILNYLDAGELAVDIRRILGVPPMTVKAICGNSKDQNKCAECATRTSLTRSSLMEQMENLMAIWIENKNQHNIP